MFFRVLLPLGPLSFFGQRKYCKYSFNLPRQMGVLINFLDFSRNCRGALIHPHSYESNLYNHSNGVVKIYTILPALPCPIYVQSMEPTTLLSSSMKVCECAYTHVCDVMIMDHKGQKNARACQLQFTNSSITFQKHNYVPMK